ncbi:MAG: hypothetical protein HY301_13100 [Verrucomicrobia bacterium]|nr:hypothetical protein [Verrucomicrobiota bacterium]
MGAELMHACPRSFLVMTFLVTMVFGAKTSAAEDKPQTILKSESFDRDPGWEGHNNRTVPASVNLVNQDFGYSATSIASKTKGEIGGEVWRASHPAWYADTISPKTLDDKLSASGTFALTATGGGGGLCFGWFNSKQTEGSSRPVAALGLQFGTEKIGGRVHVRLHTAENHSAGMVVQPAGVRKDRGPFHNDGTRYTWKLDYDPQANDGKGRVTFTFRSNLAKPEPFESKTYVLDLPDGYRKQGTIFDRFGLMNVTKPGGHLTAYFGDLTYDGHAPDLSKDPHWESVGNRAASAKGAGANDFGFSNTSHTGGKSGEVGGVFWRSGKVWGHYADRVGPLSLDDRLEAGGKVFLEVGAADSGLYFGWFRSGTKDAPDRAGNFLGVKVAGPSRVGHYFAPAFTTAKGTARTSGKAPVLIPGRAYDWTLTYDPTANGGLGSIRVTLGAESFTFDLKRGDKAQGGQFDRFGLFSVNNDGGHAQAKIWFDDLKYSAGRAAK